MFESLKKLFSRSASSPPSEPPAQSVAPSPAPPATPFSRPAPAAAPRPVTAPVPLQTGDVVQLPLNDILSQLPPTVAPLLLALPGGTFSLPVRNALEQLGTGAVRVRFAVLRQSTIPGTFANDTSQDDTLIDLPLPQILAAIGPAAFARRSNQKVTEVPEEVAGVFGPKGVTPLPAVPRPATALSPARAPAITPAPPPPPPPPPRPVPPIKPVSPAPPPKPLSATPAPFTAPKAPTPLPFAPRPAPPPPIPESPKPAAPTGDDGTLVTTIAAICQSWPVAIRQEIERSNLGGASVSIPVSRLEAGMKAGRVMFAWGELIGWVSPKPPAPSPQGAAELDLPLAVIAPLFLGKIRAATPQKKVSVGQNIPDLFAGLVKSPAAAPTPAPAPAAVAAAPTPVAAVAAAVAAPEPDALGELLGQPFKTEWTPQEIARQIAALPGVSGSLLATADGLLIAGQVPAPLEAATVAAFLPQIFGRMTSYSEEVKLGALRAVTLSTDSTPCAMFKAGALHLAVVGNAGQSLPEAMLLRIAAELSKLNP